MDKVGLVEAWGAWDRWARRMSADGAAWTRGERAHPPRVSARSGAAVSARLVETEIEYARELGMRPTELHAQIAEALRAGLSIAEAVDQVTARAAGPAAAAPQ